MMTALASNGGPGSEPPVGYSDRTPDWGVRGKVFKKFK